MSAPPRWITDLLLRPASPAERAEILADLRELLEHRGEGRSRVWRGLWLGWQLLAYAWALRIGASHLDASRPGGPRRSSPGTVGVRQPLASMAADLRHAVRGFIRSPGVALVAVPTIALAVGATTSIFSFADALLLRPLAVREPHRLLSLVHVSTEAPGSYSSFSFPDFTDLRGRIPSLRLAARAPVELRIGDGAASREVAGQIVSWEYFDVLGVEPLLGRTFRPDEGRTPGTHPVAVIGERLWRTQFGGARSAVGRQLTVNGRPFTIVGVVPRAASGTDLDAAPVVWAPLMMHETVIPGFRAFGIELFGNRGTHWLELVGRMEEGTDRRVIAEALRAAARGQAEAHPETNGGWSIQVMDPRVARAGIPEGRSLVRLTGLVAAVVVMVLLIACANVANLLLAAAAGRRREMAVRRALGAGRVRLIRQVLTEALTLALVGGGAGVLLAWALMAVLPSLGPAADLPGLDARLDHRVLGFAVGLSVLTGVVFGVVPATRSSSVDIARATGTTGPAGAGAGGRRGPGRMLVAVQVGVSLVLLVGAGLTLRTVWNLRSVPLGFDTRDVRLATVDLSETGYGPERQTRLYEELLESVRTVPGVRSASLARVSPFSTMRMANDVFWQGGGSAGSRSRTNVDMNVVAADYFATLRIPLVRGRTFTSGDRAGAPGVGVLNEALARRLWPGEDPVGRRLWSWNPDGPDQALDVVGVVADGRYHRSWQTGDRPFLFLPLGQHPASSMVLHVRGSGPAAPSPEVVRRLVSEAGPGVPAPEVRTVDQARSDAMELQRTIARLLTLFGALATFMAAMGIYGVASFSARRRTHEIGVRMALGARPAEVRRLVILGSVAPILLGVACGWMAAWGLGPLVSDLLYGVKPGDPATFGAVALGLTAVGILASWVPARRATRVDPLRALRE